MSFQVNVVTPHGPVAQTEAGAVIAPGELGEVEILEGHVPFLTQLKAGVLRLGEGEDSVFAVSKGFLEVEPGGAVQVLVERAIAASKVDLETARAEATETEAELDAWKDEPDAEYKVLLDRHAWAQARVEAGEMPR